MVTPKGGTPAPASLTANIPLFSSHPALDPQLLTPPQAFGWDGKQSAPSEGTAGASGLDQRPQEFEGGSSNPAMAKRTRGPGISWKRHQLSHGTQLKGLVLEGANPFTVTGI